MEKIFVMSSSRSGTFFLSELFKFNVKNCVSKHEPDPDMFGKPIYWNSIGNKDKIKKLFKKKCKKIEKYMIQKKDLYLESNHAFLKSFCDVAAEFYPDLRLIHLIRNPLAVAKSQLNRGIFVGKSCKIPGYYNINNYRVGLKKKVCRWALSGEEEIFKKFSFNLTNYQKLLVQWIEIENRAIDFLRKYSKYNDCYTIETTKDFYDKNKIQKMFDFFGLETKQKEIFIPLDKNVGDVQTVVTKEDADELKKLIEVIPKEYIKIFDKKPYLELKWINCLIK